MKIKLIALISAALCLSTITSANALGINYHQQKNGVNSVHQYTKTTPTGSVQYKSHRVTTPQGYQQHTKKTIHKYNGNQRTIIRKSVQNYATRGHRSHRGRVVPYPVARAPYHVARVPYRVARAPYRVVTVRQTRVVPNYPSYYVQRNTVPYGYGYRTAYRPYRHGHHGYYHRPIRSIRPIAYGPSYYQRTPAVSLMLGAMFPVY